MAAAPAAAFDQVVKDYPLGWFRRKRIRALDQVSLRVEHGEVLGLIGPNRAGKTTLIKLLLSLSRPTSGRIERLGQPAADRRTLARVGYVHENHAFPRYLSAEALLHYYGALTLVPHEVLRHRVPELLERVALRDRAHEPIAGFSKGMIQRLGLAQALINDPDLLVLDEPSEGLDLLGKELVIETVRARRRAGKTVVLVSHVLADVESLCDRVAVLQAGRVQYHGSVDELKRSGRPGRSAETLEKALVRLYQPA
ncbi:MAG: ABC transporter ATP-binding protein [Gemmataceae bacterium]|nr:ABC transporter ATP-binding protein [Gemmataceae bacterium]